MLTFNNLVIKENTKEALTCTECGMDIPDGFDSCLVCGTDAPTVVTTFPCPNCGTEHNFITVAQAYQMMQKKGFPGSPRCGNSQCKAQLWPDIHPDYSFKYAGNYGINVDGFSSAGFALLGLMIVIAARIDAPNQTYRTLVSELGQGPRGPLDQIEFNRLLAIVFQRSDHILSWKQNNSSNQTRKDVRLTLPANPTREELRAAMLTLYNVEELKTLCFELRVDYEDLGGDNLSGKIRELILLSERKLFFPRVVKTVRQKI